MTGQAARSVFLYVSTHLLTEQLKILDGIRDFIERL